MLNYELKEELIAEAKKYEVGQLDLFLAEIGWQDWMNDYTEAADGEPISDKEGEAIDAILTDIFNEAHKAEE